LKRILEQGFINFNKNKYEKIAKNQIKELATEDVIEYVPKKIK